MKKEKEGRGEWTGTQNDLSRGRAKGSAEEALHTTWMLLAPGQKPGVEVPEHWAVSMHTPRIPFTVQVVCAAAVATYATKSTNNMLIAVMRGGKGGNKGKGTY
jgi:hypothetical protein